MKKRFLSLLLATVILAGATGCGSAKKKEEVSKQAQTPVPAEKASLTIGKVKFDDPKLEEEWKKEPAYGRKLKINFDGGLCASTLGVAHAKGYFAKEGIETEVVNNPEPKDALATGKIDVMVEHISTTIVPAINGLNIAYTTAVNTGCKTMFVASNSDIKSTKDLEGKVVAISGSIGGGDHNIALRFFAKDKVDISKIKFKSVEKTALIPAMEKGEVQACILSDQFAKKFADQGVIRPIRSITFDEDFKVEPCCLLILNREFVEKNPITAAKITKAHKEASEWVEANKKEVLDVIAANNWGSGNRELDEYFLNAYSFKVSDEQTKKSLTDVVEDYKNFGLIDKNKTADEILGKLWLPINQK